MALDVRHRDKNGENTGSTATHGLYGVKKLALIAAPLLAVVAYLSASRYLQRPTTFG
jgi:hypothetical protein